MSKFFKITACTLSIVFSQTTLSSPSHGRNFETQNFNSEFNSLDNVVTRNRKGKLNEWKVLKGLAGLWIGAQVFLSSVIGTVSFLTIPTKELTEAIPPSIEPSSLSRFLTNRFVLLSLTSSLTVFSLWLLKRSVANIYYGFNGTENTTEYLE